MTKEQKDRLEALASWTLDMTVKSSSQWVDDLRQLLDEHASMENTLNLIKDLADSSSDIAVFQPQA